MNPYLNDLVAYRKSRNSLPFKCKLIEAYRAERVQASKLEEKLGISGTELCGITAAVSFPFYTPQNVIEL